MPVSVTLPDGSTIEVPSRRKEIKSREIGRSNPSIFVEEPAPHEDYDFKAFLGGWRAVPKRD